MKFSLFRLRVVSGTLVPFVDCHPLSSSLHPALSLSTCFSPFHRRHSTHLTQLVKDIYQLFLFFSLICWRNVTKRSIFGEGFFSVSVCSKMNEFVRFLCDQGTGIFVCCFGIGCTVPYIIIFFCLFVSHTFVIFMILISLYLIVLLKAF